MIKRMGGYLTVRKDPAPEASQQIERRGFAVLAQVFSPDEIAKLRTEIESAYAEDQPDMRMRPDWERSQFRYAMLNRSGLAQEAVGHRGILDVIEPLLGEDCHVIANTAWRNPPDPERNAKGGFWHIDAGPHIPRPKDVPWDDRIPYPIFAIGAHILLQDCPAACGPTQVIPGSHRSGRIPPLDRGFDADVSWEGEGAVLLDGRAGDVALFASDVWHRRTPAAADDTGRFFLQAHYGRRDIAQRLRTTAEVNQLSAEAIERAVEPRARTLVGLHDPMFYDG